MSAGAGTYLVKISNDLGSVDSSEMELTVLVPPAVIGDMISVEQLSGTSTGRVLEVSGTEPFTYVWYKDGLIIEAKEKVVISDNASAGVYCFRNSTILLEAIAYTLNNNKYMHNNLFFKGCIIIL